MKDAQRELKALPRRKTAYQIGQAQALRERINTIKQLKTYKGTKRKADNGINDIVVER